MGSEILRIHADGFNILLTISAMDLSDIAVLRTVLFFVKPLNTGPDVIPDRCNQCCKAVTASISLSSMAGMEITWPCPAIRLSVAYGKTQT